MTALDELQRVLSEWDKAEKAIKISEQITGQVPIPSIMELRYAGRRIADYFRAAESDPKQPAAISLLIDAEYDCIRAQHDAADIAVNFITIFVDQILQKIEPFSLEDEDVRKISDYLDRVERFKVAVVDSRSDRKNRPAIYEILLFDLEAITEDFSIFKKECLHLMQKSDAFHSLGQEKESVAQLALSGQKLRSFMQRSILVAAAIAAILSSLISFTR